MDPDRKTPHVEKTGYCTSIITTKHLPSAKKSSDIFVVFFQIEIERNTMICQFHGRIQITFNHNLYRKFLLIILKSGFLIRSRFPFLSRWKDLPTSLPLSSSLTLNTEAQLSIPSSLHHAMLFNKQKLIKTEL